MTTYYINADSGNDSTGTGAVGNPWATLAKALASSATTDTIVCQDSTATYAWVGANIGGRTIKGLSVGGAIFDGAGASVGGLEYDPFWLGTSPTLQLLTFQNAVLDVAAYSPVFFSSGYTPTNTWTFEQVTFRDLAIHSGTAYWYGGAIFGRMSLVVRNCEIYGITKTPGAASPGRIVNNFTVGGVLFESCSCYFGEALTVFIKHDTMPDASFVNCAMKTAAAFTFVDGNAVDASHCAFNGFTSPPTGTGVITSDPLFVDAPGGNLALRPDSPCLNTGTIP